MSGSGGAALAVRSASLSVYQDGTFLSTKHSWSLRRHLRAKKNCMNHGRHSSWVTGINPNLPYLPTCSRRTLPKGFSFDPSDPHSKRGTMETSPLSLCAVLSKAYGSVPALQTHFFVLHPQRYFSFIALLSTLTKYV